MRATKDDRVHGWQAKAVSRWLVLVIAVLLALTPGCGGPSSQGGETPADSARLPELTDELIRERINGERVWDVPPESGTGTPIVWNFDHDEPKEITVVDRQTDGVKATIVLDIKTSSHPRARNPRFLAGQIRTQWELRTGWALRRWEIDEIENISMKYRDLPKPPSKPPPGDLVRN